MPKVNGSYFGTQTQPIFPTYQTAGMLQPTPSPAAAPTPPADTPAPIGVQPPQETPTTGQPPIFDIGPIGPGGLALQPQTNPGRAALADSIMRLTFTEF